ncbi:regulatory protein [Scheffersomyces xylosifermentans]|uniref:regulatory protein n=1 Tax=Scheffersomyces xylosifermentans TaxID=1304137 RepID=UPI00315D72DD
MDKYLMSSPTQLSQPFDVSSDGSFHHLNNVDFYEAQYGNGSGENAQNDVTSSGDDQDYAEELFLSQRPPARHQATLSTSSIVSISQEPPTSLQNLNQNSQYHTNGNGGFVASNNNTNGTGNMTQSFSTSTLYSIDSIPQLSSSVSNQSLSDSPSSLQHIASYPKSNGQSNSQPIMATPRRVGRNKSLSVSSVTNNTNNFANIGANNLLFNTPMRGGPVSNAALSPVNLSNAPSSKVTKTPHTSKKGHSRSRSRMSIDATNIPMTLGGVAASKSTSFSNLVGSNTNLNPFYTPSSFVSPRVEKIGGELDDIGTPLQTPMSKNNFSSHNASNSMGNGSINQTGSFFSPSTNQSTAETSNNSTGPYTLKRHDTLDSIKIEEQDDDALKQLRKAKSFSSIHKVVESNKSLQNNKIPLNSNRAQFSIQKDDSFFNAADLSLRLSNQLGDDTGNDTIQANTTTIINGSTTNHSNEESQVVSSSSTPGIFYTNNSPSVAYGQPFNVSDASKAYNHLVPNSANVEYNDASFLDNSTFQRSNSSNTVTSAARTSTSSYRSKGIDLLSPSFSSDQNNSIYNNNIDKFNKNLSKNLSQSATAAPFTKSYPASIDLASIATSPLNSLRDSSNNQSAVNFQDQSRPQSGAQMYSNMTNGMVSMGGVSQSGLLPPMAAFPVSQDVYGMQYMQTSLNGDNSLPVSATGMNSANVPVADTKAEKDKVKKHKCPVCDSRFQRPEHVKRHMKSHSSEKPFECDEPECGKRFNRKDNLKAHLKKIHGRVG